MTTVVVTGGFGYAGGRIVRNLIECGATVRVSTRRQTANVPDWARQSVTWGGDYDALFEGADCAIHLAAPNEIECARNPNGSVDTTVNLTLNAIGAAQTSGLRRFDRGLVEARGRRVVRRRRGRLLGPGRVGVVLAAHGAQRDETIAELRSQFQCPRRPEAWHAKEAGCEVWLSETLSECVRHRHARD